MALINTKLLIGLGGGNIPLNSTTIETTTTTTTTVTKKKIYIYIKWHFAMTEAYQHLAFDRARWWQSFIKQHNNGKNNKNNNNNNNSNKNNFYVYIYWHFAMT